MTGIKAVTNRVAMIKRSIFFTGNSFSEGLDRDNVLPKVGSVSLPAQDVRCSENGTKMTLLSALEDLLTKTLGALPGLFAKLEYLASLREDGRYAHWGLTHVYGEVSATRALVDAHALVSSEVSDRCPSPVTRRWVEDG